MVTAEQLHRMVDELAPDRWAEAEVVLRRLIQDSGAAEAQDTGDPDLSSLDLHEVRYRSTALRFRRPRRLEVKVDRARHVLSLEDQELGIDVFAHTREQLVAELNE